MDQNQRNLGMKALDTLAKSNLSSFLTELGKILSNESKDSKIRILSAILIKNSLLYTEDFRQAWKSQMTKEDLCLICDNFNIKYRKNSSVKTLVKLILESDKI
jgi:hypothetical protein